MGDQTEFVLEIMWRNGVVSTYCFDRDAVVKIVRRDFEVTGVRIYARHNQEGRKNPTVYGEKPVKAIDVAHDIHFIRC